MKSSLRIPPWRASDAQRLVQLGGLLSPETIRSRFWTGYPAIPVGYLVRIEQRWPHDWDAVVAVRDGQLAGWAEYGRNASGSGDADAAFCVIDSERGRGVGTALMRALITLSGGAGITTLHADIAADNTRALRAWRRATQGLQSSMTLGIDGYRATIDVPATLIRAA